MCRKISPWSARWSWYASWNKQLPLLIVEEKKRKSWQKSIYISTPLLHQLQTTRAVTLDAATEILVNSHQICTSSRHLLTCLQAVVAWLLVHSGGNWWLIFIIFIIDRKNSDFLWKNQGCETGEQIWSGSIQTPGNK